MVMLTHSDHEMRKYYDAAMLHFESNMGFFLKKANRSANLLRSLLALWAKAK